jgi:hypothetical protein
MGETAGNIFLACTSMFSFVGTHILFFFTNA